MGSTEQWEYEIVCPQCGARGTAEVTELDGWAFMNAIRDKDKKRWIKPSTGFELDKPPHPDPKMADFIKRGMLSDRIDDSDEHIMCSACKVHYCWGDGRPRIHTVISENNDEPATEQVVDGWKRNFERRAKEFGEGHKSLIKKD